MLTYSCDQLQPLNHAGPTARLARRAFYRHRLWESFAPESVVTSVNSAPVSPISKDVKKNVNKRSAADVNCIAHTSQLRWFVERSISVEYNRRYSWLARRKAFGCTRTDGDLAENIFDFTAVDAVRVSYPAHGSVVFLHRKHRKCTRITLPQLTSFGGLCTRLSVGGESFIFLSIYRPGSSWLSCEFYYKLTSVLE